MGLLQANGKSMCMWYLPAAETFGGGFFVCGARGATGKGGNVELYATELMGSLAYDVDGHFVGRVREFFIEPAEQSNRISHYLL
jgi:hypothetical protein